MAGGTQYFLPLLLVSPIAGSFIGRLSCRLIDGRSFVWGRSECDSCRIKLGVFELIPVASWIFQGGRCKTCHNPLSANYLAIEGFAVVPVLWAATLVDGVLLILTCWYAWLLLALAWT